MNESPSKHDEGQKMPNCCSLQGTEKRLKLDFLTYATVYGISNWMGASIRLYLVHAPLAIMHSYQATKAYSK
jgi:hypothetical protein